MNSASLEALAATGEGAPDRALAARHLPIWMLDRNEPYQPLAAGYTMFRAPGRSPSSKFDIVPKAAAVIEYAVWYDWDIGHLYDLEHVWVHVDEAGAVVAVEASAHGRRGDMDAGNGLPELRDGRPVVYSEPGKHAHWARPEHIDAGHEQRLTAECGARAGIEGVHLGNPFAASGAYKATELDHRLARLKMRHDAFRPAFDFVPANADVLLAPWPALADWIPRRVEWLVAALPEKVAPFTLTRGESLVAWEMSAISERYFPGTPAPAQDPLNYRFINGFVDVGDEPCRIATFAEIAERNVVPDNDWKVESLYLPGTSRRVEFPLFRHRPTRLARWCRTVLVAPRDGLYRFRLGTRGGVHVFIDGELAAKFEPFTRNADQQAEIELPLKAAGSTVLVLAEDLAERDTNWYFELVLASDTELGVRLDNVPDNSHAGMLQRLAAEVRPRDEFLGQGPLVLVFDTPQPRDIGIAIVGRPTSHDKSLSLEATVTLPAGATEVTVPGGDGLPEGYHDLALTFIADKTRIERVIAIPVLRQLTPARLQGDLAARKRQALAHIAAHGEMRMGTALAMLAMGMEPDGRFRAIIEHTLTLIEERHDCSDFVLVPLLWAYARHGARFPADLAERTATAALNYRYWVDEPGNDVMWFWSENHVLCFHVSQLLAGQLFGAETFTNSNRTGVEQAALATERLGKWFDAVEEEGLAEWNSAAYYPVDLIGLLALVEFAPPPLDERARKLCDLLFTMVALHTLNGVPSGTMGRAYDKELRAGPLTELAPFAAVAFGSGWLNRGVASLPEFVIGSYEPPADLMALVAPEAGMAVSAHYVQGYKQPARLGLYKTANVQLSVNMGAKAGSFGHQQHVIDIRFAGHPFARAWINHPGEDDPYGHNRPSYWAGNGVLPRAAQHGDTALLLYDLGANPRMPFTHAYIARSGTTVSEIGGWLLVESGGGFAAITATSPLTPVTAGPSAGHEWRADGPLVGWVVIVGDDRETLIDRIRAKPALANTRLVFGNLVLDWRDGLSVDGSAAPFPTDSVAPVIELA